MKGERRKRGPHPGECHPKYDFYKGKEMGNKYGKLRGKWGKEGIKEMGNEGGKGKRGSHSGENQPKYDFYEGKERGQLLSLLFFG